MKINAAVQEEIKRNLTQLNDNQLLFLCLTHGIITGVVMERIDAIRALGLPESNLFSLHSTVMKKLYR
jgi:hypothetical protein